MKSQTQTTGLWMRFHSNGQPTCPNMERVILRICQKTDLIFLHGESIIQLDKLEFY